MTAFQRCTTYGLLAFLMLAIATKTLADYTAEKTASRPIVYLYGVSK